MKAILFALALVTAGTSAVAQDCPSAPPLISGTAAAGAPVMMPGQAVLFELKPAPQMHFDVPGRRTDDAGTWGGIAVVKIETAGTWRISLGSGAWITMVQDGAEIQSSAHRHGDACFPKMVDFPLQAGRAVIEISAAPGGKVRLMAAPAG